MIRVFLFAVVILTCQCDPQITSTNGTCVSSSGPCADGDPLFLHGTGFDFLTPTNTAVTFRSITSSRMPCREPPACKEITVQATTIICTLSFGKYCRGKFAIGIIANATFSVESLTGVLDLAPRYPLFRHRPPPTGSAWRRFGLKLWGFRVWIGLTATALTVACMVAGYLTWYSSPRPVGGDGDYNHPPGVVDDGVTVTEDVELQHITSI